MKKEYWVVGAIIVVLVLVGGYLGRHKIRALLSGTASSPTSQTTGSSLYGTTPTATPSGSTTTGDVVSTKTGANGAYLVASNGMTLYTFDKDTKGVSNCSGTCASTWPSYTTTSQPSSMPQNLAVITRSDGSMQYTWKGMPLYYFSGDSKPGDMNGDGVNGVWHVAKP